MSAYEKWGHYVAAHSRKVMWISLAVIFVGLALSPIFQANLLGLGYQTPGTESDDATKFIEDRTGVGERDVLVVSTEDGEANLPGLTRALAEATKIAKEHDEVVAVIPPGQEGGGQVSRDRSVMTATVLMKGEIADRQEVSKEINEDLPGEMPDGITAGVTGNSPLLGDLVKAEEKDLVVAELVGLPIAFLILMLALRSLVAALLPLALGISALIVTLGILAVTLLVADWNVFVETLVAMIGLGIGIDYALLIVRRYREELATGKAPPDAIARTLQTAGHTVTFSGAIVAVSMIGMAISGLPFFAESAIGVMLVVIMMVIGALTFLPALLIRLGDNLDRVKLPEPKNRERDAASRWERWATFVMRRPVPFLAAGVTLLLVCSIPLLNLKTGTDLNARAMEGEPSADTLAVLEGAFPDASLAPVEVVVKVDGDGSLVDATRAAEGAMSSENLLGDVSAVPLGRDAALLLATPTVAADTIEADHLVRDLRPAVSDAMPPGASSQITGVTAELVDYTDETNDWTPFILGFALILSFFLLLWVFRSPVLAIKAIILNLLSIGAAIGLTILVFQDGHGEGILDFTSLGFIQGWMPITLFMLLFGLSMDYEVFMVTRIREEYDKGGDTTSAIARGLGRTGTVVTAAAAIMIAIFASFMIVDIPEIKQMGFGLAVAVLIDATIVRMMLVPALMKLFGKWNWWMPKALDEKLPRFEHG